MEAKARPDVVAHHRDAPRRQPHRDRDDNLEKLHHDSQHRHGDLSVLRLSEDGVQSAAAQGHILNRRHGHNQRNLGQKAAHAQRQVLLCQLAVGRKLSRSRRTAFIWHRYQTARAAVRICPSTVATAAPIMPHRNPKIKMGSRMMLTSAPARVEAIARFGLPSERIMGLSA